MDVRTRAWRVLAKGGHLVGYRHLDPGTANEDRMVQRVSLTPFEEAIGVYENPPDSGVQAIVVTTQALRVLASDGVHVIPYASIRAVSGPPTKDVARPTIAIRIDDGSAVEVPVLGRKGGALDVFEVLRFLKRVVEDIGQYRRP